MSLAGCRGGRAEVDRPVAPASLRGSRTASSDPTMFRLLFVVIFAVVLAVVGGDDVEACHDEEGLVVVCAAY